MEWIDTLSIIAVAAAALVTILGYGPDPWI
jgi:hypothetical protein